MTSLTAIDRFQLMARMRAFDTACLAGAATLEIHGELHTGIGQEAIAAGLAGWLRDEDALVSTHRNHYHALAKGVDARALMAEIFERETGLCRGRGGHMHPFDPAHNFSATGIVGASLPVALGYAYAFAIEGDDRVAMAVTGDGGTNHGTFHECLNLAGAWALPFIVLVENNHLAISVDSDDFVASATIAERASVYGALAERVDGTDAEAVSASVGRAVAAARLESRPALIEATCHRFQGHYEGDVQPYRSLRERERVRRDHDPLVLARARLTASGRADAATLDRIESDARAEIEALLRAVRAEPLPDPAGARDGVFAEDGS